MVKGILNLGMQLVRTVVLQLGYFLSIFIFRITVTHPIPPPTLTLCQSHQIIRPAQTLLPINIQSSIYFIQTFSFVAVFLQRGIVFPVFSSTLASPLLAPSKIQRYHFKQQSVYFYDANVNVEDSYDQSHSEIVEGFFGQRQYSIIYIT